MSFSRGPLRYNIGRIALASVIVAVLGALLFLANFSFVQRAALEGVLLPAIGDSGLSRNQQDILKKQVAASLSSAPINQGLLGTYITLIKDEGADEYTLSNAFTFLSDLGWRSTAAQQNLIAHALAAGDIAAIVDRSDALIRRGKFVDEITALLLGAEQNPAGRALVLRALERRPKWADLYIRLGAQLTTPEGLIAHAALLRDLDDSGYDIGRREAVPLVRAMIRQGLLSQAYGVFEQVAPQSDGQSDGVYDPDFRVAAEAQRNGPLFPFEWNWPTQRGVRSTVRMRGDAGRLNLKWNGKGHPLLLSQIFPVEKNSTHALRVTFSGNNSSILNSLQFYLSCADSGGEKLLLRPKLSRPEEATYEGEIPDTCSFAKLELYGLLEIGAPPLDLFVDRIESIN